MVEGHSRSNLTIPLSRGGVIAHMSCASKFAAGAGAECWAAAYGGGAMHRLFITDRRDVPVGDLRGTQGDGLAG